ncbi:hypothetical protein K504DRAFT_495621 [Pleomassaria siparia CBS 279.74]|uniref:Heterokaryon incompatibility domain-containing protein n=1 Tax=Pleomassaria siparia CBS 279.74 TaxID=1314801 RepID=A0A6G1JSD5_9PLEO|nr:hypothetical protein K504DRAFT_495621 [Pleomassaria siparia CBS 279.74]
MQYQIEAAALYRNYPLDHERSQIRLLIVHPGEWEDDISCDFKIVSLDHHPTYAALSYAWGREEPDSLAKIGACLVPIRPSLFAALRRLRAHAAGKDETIWVDALCINQASIDERNSQVAMMGQIYSLCTSVSVWLGELEFAPEICPGSPIEANPGRCYTIDHGGECPSSREGIHAIMGNIPEWEGLLRIATYLSLMAARGSTSFITYLVEYSLAKHDLQERLFTKIIQGLESNEWFNRLWVVQEYILASAVTVYIGPVALPWTMFSRASEAYRNFLSWAYASAPETHDASCRILINTGIIRFVEFAKLRDSIRERPERQTILELRLQLSRRFASVDLDQIYSLYGVHGYIQDHDGEDAAREPEDSPNYNDPPEGTYVVTSLRHFKEARSLLPLSLSSYKQKYTSTPSWTIDWTALQSDQIGFDHRLWTEMYGMFHADHGLGEPQSCFTNHNTIMSLQGVLIDEVIVAARFDNEEERSAFMDTMRTRDPAGLYPGNEQMTWADAWFRTVVADSSRLDTTRESCNACPSS